MEVKLKLSNTEHKDLVDYCNLNDLLISSVVKDSFTAGFHIEKYGLLNSDGVEEKQVVKEVIVEKRVEIPVEVIKEVIVEEESSEISMSTLIVDNGGKFNQTSLSNAIKKASDKLVTKIFETK
jgi:hypothetical protein